MIVKAVSSISHQNTFRNNGFSLSSEKLKRGQHIMHPDYSVFIPPLDRRRMTDASKMSAACSADCLLQTETKSLDGIIIGTSMGCSQHTKVFLDKIREANDGLISPSSFISSLHNTIAGQISIAHNITGYNNTHCQNSLSFEAALVDAKLFLNENNDNVLVGAYDESEETLFNLNERLGMDDIEKAGGASFFILENETNGTSGVKIKDVTYSVLDPELKETTINFLDRNQLQSSDIDLLLYTANKQSSFDEIEDMFTCVKMNYSDYTGYYLTNSALATHYGIDFILSSDPLKKNVLIWNNLIPENLGLILLQSL